MGIQTMGSQGSGQQSQFQPLARQGSFYSLTLDEVQSQLGDLGKPLSSMNLDELLKNVWSAEGNITMGMDIENAAPASQFVPPHDLQRQSSMTFPRALSKKTVDEVWRDIQQGQKNSEEERKAHERQPTLGEMTLEDFLVKAGIVAESSDKNKRGQEGDINSLEIPQGMCNASSVMGVGTQNFSQAQWLQYQPNVMGMWPAPQPLAVGASPILDVAYTENQMGISSPLMGSDIQTPGHKRGASGDVIEKTVERRQKRMIKNRESAARSRARKQAYTNELENKVSRLEEENERLKKQKELENIFPCVPPPEPKYQLRRTSSAPL